MKNKMMKLLAAILLILLPVSNCTKKEETTAFSTLQFKILDKGSKEPIPGKLIFIQGKDEEPDLNISQAVGICAEKNGFYTASGKGSVDIPVGRYEVYASRGMEYSIDKKRIKIKKGKVTTAVWKIEREINPEGFIISDLHMHTTNSDGKPTPEERVTTLLGEGLEFAAVTDHNYVTDLSPESRALNAGDWIKICPGNEYTTGAGHYNVYPLAPETEPFDHSGTDARVHFGYVRALSKPLVLQVNHPRWEGLDYFGHFGVNPLTGDTDHPQFSWDFDAMEIMNETAGWGLFTGASNTLSVWEDWFNFLNKNFRPTGVGTSDTHASINTPPGMPADYILCEAAEPSQINPEKIAESIINHHVCVSRGVFVNLTANQKYPVGTEFTLGEEELELTIQVQAASWVKPDKVTLYGNGRVVWEDKIEQVNGPLNYEKKITLEPEIDTWYIVKTEGEKSLFPIVPKTELGDVTPVGFTNPIWVDIDGDGFECERDRANNMLAEVGNDVDKFRQAAADADWVLQKQLFALTLKKPVFEKEMIKLFAISDQKFAREIAYQRLAELADEESISLLKSARQSAPEKDERILAATYLATLGSCEDRLKVIQDAVKTEDKNLKGKIVKILSLNRFVREWQIIGPFHNIDDKGLETAFAPEVAVDYQKTETGKNDKPVKWEKGAAQENGYVNYLDFYEDYEHSVCYAHAVINAPEEMETALLFGSDDGAAVWHDGKQIYYRFVRRGAAPGQEIIPVTLKKGDNIFLVKVENGGGGFGFYFELLDPCEKLEAVK